MKSLNSGILTPGVADAEAFLVACLIQREPLTKLIRNIKFSGQNSTSHEVIDYSCP